MTQTDRLKLKLPDGTDNIDVDDFNHNMRLLDEKILANNNITDYIFPVGSILPYVGVGSNPPDGWLFCNGQTLNITTYQKLYDMIGNNYSSSDISPNSFRVPDLRSKFPLGAGNKWNEYGDNPGTYKLGDYGGEETVKLTTNEMPSHTHNYTTSSPGHVETGGTSSIELLYWDMSPNTITTSVGGNAPHNNMPPFSVVNYIIKY